MRKTRQSTYEIWLNIMLLQEWSVYETSTYYSTETKNPKRKKVTQSLNTQKQIRLSASTLCKSALAMNDLARQALPILSTSLLETQQPTIITTCAPHFSSSSTPYIPPSFLLLRYVTNKHLNLPFPLQVRRLNENGNSCHGPIEVRSAVAEMAAMDANAEIAA